MRSDEYLAKIQLETNACFSPSISCLSHVCPRQQFDEEKATGHQITSSSSGKHPCGEVGVGGVYVNTRSLASFSLEFLSFHSMCVFNLKKSVNSEIAKSKLLARGARI